MKYEKYEEKVIGLEPMQDYSEIKNYQAGAGRVEMGKREEEMGLEMKITGEWHHMSANITKNIRKLQEELTRTCRAKVPRALAHHKWQDAMCVAKHRGFAVP